MPGGWGGPCVPAHGPNIFTLGHLTETVTPRTHTQTPRTHAKPISTPAPAPARVVDLPSW